MKTVALKNPRDGTFQMIRLSGVGTISSDNREDYGTRVSLGNIKTSLDLKESRIVTLEDDKVVKDSKISTLESDKNDKDTRVAALESDKNSKDSKISDIESDIDLLASQVSLGNVRVSLGNLATRVSSLETLGIKGISNTVSWTNLTEINLSGEKLTNGDFSSSGYVQDTSFCLTQTCGLQPNNNHPSDHTFASRPKIVALQTASGLTAGTYYEVKVANTTNGGVNIWNLGGASEVGWYAGTGRGTLWEVVNLAFDDWSVHSGTLDQTKLASGIVDGSGGAVAIVQNFSQTIPSGTELIFKVTRADTNTGNVRFNPIRSSDGVIMSVNIGIDPSVGYASYTTTVGISGVKLDTLHGLREVSSVSVFQGEVSGGTVQAYAGGGLEKISGTSGYNSGGFSVNYIPGNSDGYFQFQLAQNNKALRVGLVYADADYSTVSPFGLDFNATGNIDNMNPYQDNITTYAQGDWFRVRHYASSNQVHFQKRQTVGNGQDYVTFLTSSTTTNGSDLYLDVAFDSVGGRINDVTIVT